MVDLETRQFRMLVAIADAGTVTRASAQLNLSQPALSHALRSLEDRIGVSLFARGPRSMVPTEAGERLIATARTVLQEIDAARDDIRRGAAGRGEFIRVSTECYTAYHWLPAVMRDFAVACPGVELRIVPSAIGNPLHALRDGIIDVGIGVQRDTQTAFQYHELFEDEVVVVLPPDHPGVGRDYFTAADFRTEHVMVYTDDPARSSLVLNILNPAGVRPRELSRVVATEALIEMVKAGVGISVFARWAVAPHLRDGSLAAVRLTARGVYRKWHAAVRREAEPVPSLQALVTLLRRHAPEFKTSKSSRSRRVSTSRGTAAARSR
jgi:LysR family transcriptional regulator for metE and metH